MSCGVTSCSSFFVARSLTLMLPFWRRWLKPARKKWFKRLIWVSFLCSHFVIIKCSTALTWKVGRSSLPSKYTLRCVLLPYAGRLTYEQLNVRLEFAQRRTQCTKPPHITFTSVISGSYSSHTSIWLARLHLPLVSPTRCDDYPTQLDFQRRVHNPWQDVQIFLMRYSEGDQ